MKLKTLEKRLVEVARQREDAYRFEKQKKTLTRLVESRRTPDHSHATNPYADVLNRRDWRKMAESQRGLREELEIYGGQHQIDIEQALDHFKCLWLTQLIDKGMFD